MYKVGDSFVHPMHGAGVVEEIQVKEFLGEQKHYYIMKMNSINKSQTSSDVCVMVPVDNAETVGVRDVIEETRAREVMEAFRSYRADDTSNWNKRYRENMEKIRSGDILDTTYVVKTLMLKELAKGLSMGEKKMLQSAKQILFSELVLATRTSTEEIENAFQSIVDKEIGLFSNASVEREASVNENAYVEA
ncbi:CarD family transcriptional regulator [Treponema sp. R6D11]